MKVRRGVVTSQGTSSHLISSFGVIEYSRTLYRYFAGEIIGNVLELEPRRWRHPRRVDFRQNQRRVAEFKKRFDAFDWTKALGKS